MVSVAELEKWDPNALVQLLGVMFGKHKRLANLGDTLDGIKRSLEGWGGEAADTWRHELGKRRNDIDEQQKQARAVTDALEPLVDQVGRVVTDFKLLKGEVAKFGWQITPDGKVTGDVRGDLMLETVRGNKETELKGILERANALDHDIAAAIRRAVAPTGMPEDPQQPPADGYTPVTAAALMRIVPELTQAKADEIVGPLNDAMREGGVNTPLRQAAFISQTAVESDRFRTYVEYGSGEEYEGRCSGPDGLGNCSPGDGVKYKGRGIIQLTGKDNYDRAGKALGVDFVNNPELAADPQWAFKTSVWFWNTHNLNALADNGDNLEVTHRINGGEHGLSERMRYYNNALQELRK